MTFLEIKNLLIQKFGDQVVLQELAGRQPQLLVAASEIVDVCSFLKNNPDTFFDLLSCITALDNSPTASTLDIIYHFYSIPHEHHLIIKITIDRGNENLQPNVDSVSSVYRTADWHEREAFDFFGIEFNNHPDLRRILLPTDWEGYPLRKDYTAQKYYHGIEVASLPSSENK